jgi:hypothetical protein
MAFVMRDGSSVQLLAACYDMLLDSRSNGRLFQCSRMLTQRAFPYNSIQ